MPVRGRVQEIPPSPLAVSGAPAPLPAATAKWLAFEESVLRPAVYGTEALDQALAGLGPMLSSENGFLGGSGSPGLADCCVLPMLLPLKPLLAGHQAAAAYLARRALQTPGRRIGGRVRRPGGGFQLTPAASHAGPRPRSPPCCRPSPALTPCW